MRKSSASWNSRSVSSGRRRSSSVRAARSRSLGSNASGRAHSSACRSIPVKDFFSGAEPHARALADAVVEPLEIADAVRHAGDVRMHADRHDARALLALLVQAIELVDAAAQPLLRGMLL